MANRPGQLCELKSGKSIGAQKNFADTFNWLVACLKNLRGGKGVKVSWPADDTPEIEAEDADGNDNGGGGGGGGDGGETGDPTAVNAVADVGAEDITEGRRLTVTYTDDRAAKSIDVPYKTAFTGTDNSATGRDVDFSFASDNYSNIEVKCVGGVITIGAFYA